MKSTQMKQKGYRLGVHIGSASVACAVTDDRDSMIKKYYALHKGDPRGTVLPLLKEISSTFTISAAGTTGSLFPRILSRKEWASLFPGTEAVLVDVKVASGTAALTRCPEADTVLRVGAERFFALSFSREGIYEGARQNTSCAAGTGSFLDQQAERLFLKGPGEIGRLADSNRDRGGDCPLIATRCAVFAKTDLIHAQQEGYSLEGICDGLCRGLAKNLMDTLLQDRTSGAGPVLFCGGVSLNSAVVRHLGELSGREILTHEDGAVFPALGAAIESSESTAQHKQNSSAGEYMKSEVREEGKNKGMYPPLTLEYSDYPSFESLEKYSFESQVEGRLPVEVDMYRRFDGDLRTVMGIDIGSTSTKAVLLDHSQNVLAGFYTRTAGRPVQAFQTILEAVDSCAADRGISLEINGFGTTGSGRKFIGAIGGADVILDEISAHAKAAAHIDAGVDTIIEIGGQDAKFTTLKNGSVTSSIMNTVCAAGTGSFIEEQAGRLNVPLRDISRLALGVRAPLASDRCTVFMERDINNLLLEGFSVPEVLGATLHAVRENYLQKVANKNAIGSRIFFQGATAKNKALAAAFEQALGKPIIVSEFCHLTGAIGTALEVLEICTRDSEEFSTSFCGLSLHSKDIPIRREVCDICTNHCKLTLAEPGGKPVAYGFLCGRDYDTKSYVQKNRSGYDLMRQRRSLRRRLNGPVHEKSGAGSNLLQFPLHPLDTIYRRRPAPKAKRSCREIGLPAGLYMRRDLVLWETFFNTLGITPVASDTISGSISEGKRFQQAEFCAPIASLHGHAAFFRGKKIPVFLPHYMEEHNGNSPNGCFCYYTQFAPGVLSSAFSDIELISPLLKSGYTDFDIKKELYTAIGDIYGVSFGAIEKAWTAAKERETEYLKELKVQYSNTLKEGEFHTVLLGRPYTILAEDMNKGIPGIFGSLGVKTFYMDQLDNIDTSPVSPLIDETHWYYSKEILSAAYTAALRPGAYPVLVSSFKCSPDSFTTDYFKELMELMGKPYLILELDEHDSSVGYETRIEAGIRAFRNHYESDNSVQGDVSSCMPSQKGITKDKTILLPNWDPVTMPMIESVLSRYGYDVRLVEETDDTIRRSMRFNNGQCLPVNAAMEAFALYMKEHHLKPEETVLWILKARLSCNITLYPYQMQQYLSDYGLEGVEIFAGDISMSEFAPLAPLDIYFAYLFGGMLRRIGCRLRPYEEIPGQTDRAIQKGIDLIRRSFSGKISKEEAVETVMKEFHAIKTLPGKRKKVAIFGDFYVRDNDVMNQDLIAFIESHGGEVITTPFSHYSRMIADSWFKRWMKSRNFLPVITFKAILSATSLLEQSYRKYFEPIVEDYSHSYSENAEDIVRQYNLRLEHSGESYDNLLKVHYIKKYHPEVELFVQTSPGFCCAGIVTEAMAERIREVTGIPVVSITYDGTGGSKNDPIIPYLRFKTGSEPGRERKESLA